MVLDVDAVTKNPEYLGRYIKRSGAATRVWDLLSSIIFVGCIVLSIFWRWWVFIPGLLLTVVLVKANRASVAEFSIEVVNANPQALEDWSRAGLIWRAEKVAVIPE